MSEPKGSDAAKTLSLLGAAKGGAARAKALSPEERSRIAREAVETRWRNAGKLRLPERGNLQATHKGNFEEEFGFDVDCYVLNDEFKTAVISQRGMGAAIGLGQGGSRLPKFIQGQKIAPYVGHELREKLSKPLIFLGPSVGTNVQPPTPIYGYDVTILIDICKSISQAEADGKLLKSQVNIARQAHIILNASAKAGIKGLVYALSGYDATREEVVAAFKFYVCEEAREYEKEFPDQLYEEWYRIYELPKPERNKPWKFMHLTVGQVYRPLAKSSGKILELTKSQRENSKARHKRLHQFLSEIGVKALRTHLGQLLGIARISTSKVEYERFFQKLFGEQLDLFDDEPMENHNA
jgi:hypothetical protein